MITREELDDIYDKRAGTALELAGQECWDLFVSKLFAEGSEYTFDEKFDGPMCEILGKANLMNGSQRYVLWVFVSHVLQKVSNSISAFEAHQKRSN